MSRPSKLLIAALATVLLIPALAQAAGGYPDEGTVWFRGKDVWASQAKLTWSLAGGTQVRSNSLITIQYQDASGWHTIVRHRPILDRTWIWNTTKMNPGAVRTYPIRALVEGTSVKGPRYGITIDHVPPVVHITSPVTQDFGSDAVLPTAIVAGRVPLKVSFSDVPNWGPHMVYWTIANSFGSTYSPHQTYDFGQHPGIVTLRATAFDIAGNAGVSETIQVLGLPAPPQV